MKDEVENCVARYYVKAHPYGTSYSGPGCRATGEHCLPNENCENRRRRWTNFLLQESKES